MVSVVQREWAGKNPRVIPGRPALTGRPGDANHCRGRSELADHRLPVPIAAVLPGDRCRRRADFGFGRARPRLPAKLAPGSEQGAGLPPRHRRECRDVDGQPDGGFHPLARLPRRRPKAFAEAGTTHNDVDHLMIYGAPCSLPGASFAHLPIYGLSGSLPPRRCYARRWRLRPRRPAQIEILLHASSPEYRNKGTSRGLRSPCASKLIGSRISFPWCANRPIS